jgi:adenine-specific DNA-methyltransferase
MAKRAKAKTAAAKTEVESYKHKEARRKNIPTAELQKLVPDDDKAIKKLRWPRNPDLDPQLVWRGKDFEPDPLEVDAPPIYIQEKILPRAIIEDLRRQTKERRADETPRFDFYHDFNGLADPEAKTEFYAHDQNWSNRMILGDSLPVMASLAEREGLRGKVQCIYMDPPYGIRFNSNWQPSTKSREVKEGNEASVSREPEVIRAFRDTWKDGINSYLGYLRDRLVVARDLLSPTGYIFVQIGEENVHLLRVTLDEVFLPQNFVSQIFFKTTSNLGGSFLGAAGNYLLMYARDIESAKSRYKQLYKAKGIEDDIGGRFTRIELADGRRRVLDSAERNEPPPEGARIYRHDNLTSRSGGDKAAFTVTFEGHQFLPGRAFWKTNEQGMVRLERASRLAFPTPNSLAYVRFLDDFSVTPFANVWTDTQTGAFTDEKIYVVQTNTKVIERCILMSTNPGDLVLDPTCGSGTTAFVAEQCGRRWITIDASRVALTLARGRLMGARYDYYLLKDSAAGADKEGELTGKPSVSGPFTNNIRHGFVYERVPHVMLQTIAKDTEIDVIWERWEKVLESLHDKLNKALKQNWKDWQVPREADEKWPEATKQLHAQWWEARRTRQKEIDESIARNADVEYLYDRPYKARGVVRVAGPFTVESLSPHRVLPMGEDPYLEELLAAGGDPSAIIPGAAKKDVDGRVEPGHDEKGGPVITDFAQVVYENLKAAGVQNTKKGETLKFEWLKPFASRSGLIQFEGRYQEKGESKRAAVCIGPEYDTVGYDLVRRAAREAADLFDTLIICGFIGWSLAMRLAP